MKNVFRASALACAAVSLSICLLNSPARADDSELVRTSQMRLASMGYYVGRYDGNMGPVTQGAIMDFQRVNGIPATGQLTPETYSALLRTNYVTGYNTGYYGYTATNYYHPAYYNPTYVAFAPAYWDSRWAYARNQELSTRYGRLDVNEEDHGTVRHYMVSFNGHPVLFANNQPGILRASQTFKMDNQDAVIFTAYQGDGNCAYKNYLLTVHSDGTFTSPREIGNCSGKYEAHVADNALFVSFPGVNLASNWGTWDVWRYEDNSLIRL
jgi:peptidoglycan hydrolase-like protein with peptidoglycan-binding domain